MSVFFAMTLIMMMSLLFSLAETARYVGLRAVGRSVTDRAIDSSGSEYNRYLWERYGILALDQGLGTAGADFEALEQRILQFAEENGDPQREGAGGASSNFFRLRSLSCEISKYGYLTDQKGSPLILQGADCAKKEMGQEAVALVKQKASKTEGDLQGLPDVEELVQNSNSAMEKAREKAEENEDAAGESSGLTEASSAASLDWENPLEVFEKLKDQGILGLVLAEEETASDQTMDLSKAVSRRNCRQGNAKMEGTVGTEEKILFARYLLNHFQYYGNSGADGGMKYEAEYVICGEDSDRANLAGVAERLLAVREAENLAAVCTDSQKMQQALSVATKIAGFTQNPGVICLVQMAVIAVWALVESILDVRLLLKGGRVAAVKSPAEWSSDLYHLGSALAFGNTAKECHTGFIYKDYLNILLCLAQKEDLGLRALDLMEFALRSQADYQDCRMDEMLCQWEAECDYQAFAMFLLFIPLTTGKDCYQFQFSRRLSYL